MDVLNNIVITELEGTSTVQNRKSRHFEIHGRSSYGLTFACSGKIIYRMNGTETVSDALHAVILPKGGSYTLDCEETGCFPLINFQCEGYPCRDIRSFRLGNAESYLKDFEQLSNLTLFPGNKLKAFSLLYDILSRLAIDNQDTGNILLPSMQYLQLHYTDPGLCNATLARQSGISEVYFRKLFSKYYGTTPRQYICDIRIRRAKQLLSEGILSVTAISEACGFSSIYHFCRAFKDKTGTTPLEYARNSMHL